jgi:hypothetical protein
MEFDPLYTIVWRTVGTFSDRKRHKMFFFSKVSFSFYFAGASLLGNRILITTEGLIDRRPLISL